MSRRNPTRNGNGKLTLKEERMPVDTHAVSSSMSGITVSPRTPNFTHRMGHEDDAEDEVEMSLLREEERRQAANGLDAEEQLGHTTTTTHSLSNEDQKAMVLLCILYLIQGVPLGLALGSIPFILKEQLSYSQLATFALSGYPYSLKLIWSPIVDSSFFASVGRRKSWIIPMQVIVGTIMLYLSLNVQVLMDDAANHVNQLTFLFTSLVFFSATQDIAVDGWALTLLSHESLSYASTCQTIGLNTGFFASFTVFLAFNSEAFTTKWGVPHLTLSAYLKFWCVMSYAVSLWLLFFKKERKEHLSDADLSIKAVYKQIWAVCKLRHVQLLIVVHFFAKVGFAANEAATSLKMVEKGFLREDLAIAVLIDFPFQIAGGWLAANWSRGDYPLRPWLIAFWPRIAFATMATLIVYWFPKPPMTMGFFAFLVLHTVLSSFTSTVQFVGISAFHTRVSDPLIGGTYMTLLNTFTNLGGTWPKYFVLKGVDMLTTASCHAKEGSELIVKAAECVSEQGKAACTESGGECVTETDGYYMVSVLCMLFGIAFFVLFITPTARKLQDVVNRILKTMSTLHSIQSSTMQFGPEWMRAKPAKPLGPSPPPPTAAPAAGASSYSALVSPAPPPPTDKRDETHPFRYSRDEMLKIYRDGGGKGGLGLEVERYEGIVREAANDPVGLRDMSDSEKKLFAGSLNSELRRRQSLDYLSPLSVQTTGERPRMPHSASSGTGSPLRERFGNLSMRRRESSDQLTAPRKLSLSNTQGPMSPRDAALPSPRTRIGHTPTFDGVLNGGESWLARRRASEAKAAARDTDPHEAPTLEIREEDEDTSATADSTNVGATQGLSKDTAPPPLPDPAPASSQSKTATDRTSYSPHVPNGSDPAPAPVQNGPPPGIQDLATVEWSYLDPQGQLQGPFHARLMQKWFDDGYFTADLLMKRTHLDVNWVAVGELVEIAQRLGSDKLFLTPPAPPPPPGLNRDLAGQGFAAAAEQNAFNSPLQPAPVRTLRSSTLDAYASGSNPSDSPSSSFGAGRFSSSSPDSHGFGGRANTQYPTDPLVGSRFGAATDTPSSLRRNAFGDPSLDPSGSTSRFGGANLNDSFAVNGSYSPSQGPWQASSSNPLTSTFDSSIGGFGSSSNLTGLGQAGGFGNLRAPQESVFSDAVSNIPDFIGSQQLGGTAFGPGQQYPHLQSTPFTAQQSPGATNVFGQPAKPVLPQPAAQTSGLPAAPTQSPWEIPTARRGAPLDSGRLNPPSTTSTATVQASPWGTTTQTNEPTTHWYAASHGVIEEHWQEDRGHSLTFSNLGQHNQQFANLPDEGPKVPIAVNEPVSQTRTIVPEPEAPAKPAAAPPQPVKARTKSNAQPLVAQTPIAPVVPAPVESAAPAAPGAVRAAWSTEEEPKRPKPSGVALSLRDIQEAEAKKTEARKVAERDRERAARATSSAVPAPEEAQPFVASWGLPTSQAGTRATPVKESPAVAAASSPGGTTPAVWTNATKPPTTKKTMKEIQEEEEKRKKVAVKDTAAQAARRAYAESTTKAPAPAPTGGAWTTVGVPKVGTPVATPARPSVAPTPSATGTSVPRANGVPTPRPAPVPAKAPAPRVEEPPAAASHEFLKWLNDSLKGLNSTVNVEEIMAMLLSFPLDPDQSTVELISDTIYSNSTTLDGRRFAAEFVSKRKADAASRPKGVSAAGMSGGKPVSIADVVKSQPKAPAANEWGGFKVVNKKKKGGRS
ncbi:GYF domain-containing protein [Favolaschia claudopus]|uniref:GYF domain-containing protein n=1 Tax=Favolaschia claudopus TaxID=2862362 RepID=A0AAW0EIY7_9AGAR